MTEEELESRIDSLLSAFLDLPETKRYLALKKALKEDKRLNGILEEMTSLQKKARLLPSPEKEKMLKKAKELYDTYREDPLVINLRSGKKELLELLRPLSDFRL